MNDSLAESLYEQLSNFKNLVANGRHSRSPPDTVDAGVGLPWSNNLFLLIPPYEAPSNRVALAVELLNLLCRPFDEASDKQAKINMALDPRPSVGSLGEASPTVDSSSMQRAGPDGSTSNKSMLSRGSLSQKLEEWSFESTLPFRVDARRTTMTEGSGAVPSLQSTSDTVVSGGGDSRPWPHSWEEGDDTIKRRKP